MEADIGYILSCALRMAIIGGVGHGTGLFLMSMLLKKKHSFRAIILYTGCKIVFLNIFIGMVIRTFYSGFYKQTMWIQVIYMIGIGVTSVLNFVMFVYTFEGGLVRIGMAAGISDAIGAFFTYFSTVVVNLIEGKNIFSFTGPVEILDFGIPVLSFGLLFLVKKFFGIYFERFKGYQFRHKKTFGVLFTAYIIFLSCYRFMANYDNPVFAYSLMFSIYILALGAFIFWVRRYQKNVQAECAFLTGQRYVMEQHFEKLLEEIRIIETQRSITEQQMGEVAALDGRGAHRERIASYRESLIEKYKELKAGMYSDDWMLDAVLSSQQEYMESQGILLECYLQDYREGKMDHQDLITLILALLHFGLRASQGKEGEKRMRLRLANVKNQLLIEYVTGWNQKGPISARIFRKYLKKYHGTVDLIKQQDQIQLTIVLQEG